MILYRCKFCANLYYVGEAEGSNVIHYSTGHNLGDRKPRAYNMLKHNIIQNKKQSVNTPLLPLLQCNSCKATLEVGDSWREAVDSDEHIASEFKRNT